MKSEKILKRPKANTSEQPKDKIQTEGNQKSAEGHKRSSVSGPVNLNIPRNVNYYSHFLQQPWITGYDINWVINLRHKNKEKSEQLQKMQVQPFSVADKNIASQEKLHTFQDINVKGNINNIQHLIKNRIGPTTTNGMVEFETALRPTSSKNNKWYEQERGFTTIPKKERKEYPQLMPKVSEEKEIRKQIQMEKNNFKNLTLEQKRLFLQKQTKLTHTAFDGFQNYPKYDYKIQTAKNIQSSKHLLTSDAFMSTTKWEMSLR